MVRSEIRTLKLGPFTLDYILKVSLLALAYFITARIGLSLNAVSGFATLVWPPTGISLAFLLIYGRRFWPGVFIGAFFANFTIGASPIIALGIGVGNALEPLIGAYLIRRFVKDFSIQIKNLHNALGLIFFGAVLSTLVSATVGVTTLLSGGTVSLSTYFNTWQTWWIGDMLGDLTFAPLILTWVGSYPFNLDRKKFYQILQISLLFFAIISLLSYARQNLSDNTVSSIFYLFFIPMTLASIRFGTIGASTSVAFVSLLVILATFRGLGSFIFPLSTLPLSDRLFILQIFMASVSSSMLILSSETTERGIRIENISELNKKLNANIIDLKKLDILKDDFINVASHELKTPLIAIIGYADLLLQKTSSKKTKEKLEIILEAARSQQKLVDDLLKISRLESGTMEFETREIQMADLIKKTTKLMLPKAIKKKIKLTEEIEENLPLVIGDESRLGEVVRNLLDNAIKFTEKGKITVRARKENKNIIVEVEDTGIGIDEEDIPKLFTKFFQADTSASRGYEGVGLGLSISSLIVEAHNGKIWVESKKGVGSKFIFTLPVKD